jgi:hypothetical protein
VTTFENEAPDVLDFLKDLIVEFGTGTGIAGLSVRRGRLASSDDPMTEAVILLEEAGSLEAVTYRVYLPFRVEITVLAATEGEASRLLRILMRILTGLTNVIRSGVALGCVLDETGPQPRQDADTDWPGRSTIAGLYMPSVLLSEAS